MKVSGLCLIILLVCACKRQTTLFTALNAEHTGITFNNQIAENEMLSVLNYEYIFNGGGVGIGDFNNDSLPDIYFGGNMVSNRLYLNKGDLQFEDITAASGTGTNKTWSKGITVIDINADGWLDIYVSAAVYSDSNARRNILWVNKGIKGVPQFENQAAAYGLDDASNTHMAAFFDYDNDGDLDVYLLLNDLDGTYPNEFRPIRRDGSWPNTDKLLQCNFDSSLGHVVYKNVSAKAGILTEGHGLGVSITDINHDGWKDIYVSNDYISNNIFYINNGDGTFTDRCSEYLKHTSKNAMGNDIADINNDGWQDIIEMDMAPADNYRQKMMFSDVSYQAHQNFSRYGYMHQYSRNTLQWHQGMLQLHKDSSAIPVFAEIAYYSGVAQTDWSWAPLLVDADNDGYRDLFISNGLPRDMSDMDFMAYRRNAVARTPLNQVLQQLPAVKISNYAYRNNGDLTFSDETIAWGWQEKTFSAGMAMADLDRDGDMDAVINNTNMPASILKNNLQSNAKKASRFLALQLVQPGLNRNAIGSLIQVYCPQQVFTIEHQPYRGYLSSLENISHAGLGNVSRIDSIVVTWPDAVQQTFTGITPDALHILQRGKVKPFPNKLYYNDSTFFTDVTGMIGLSHFYDEVDFIDFNIQRLIPHKFSQYGPSLAAADLNGDGLDDFVCGGGSPNYATLFLQQPDGRFRKTPLVKSKALKYQDDAGIALFDADNDGDKDMYIASGGGENEPFSPVYADNFFVNDGKGNFTPYPLDIFSNRSTKSTVRAADFDGDGDEDLLVTSRFIPGRYPMPASSFLYRNDSEEGKIIFTDVTKTNAAVLQGLGLVTDAVWSDLDNDLQPDIILSLEWGAITILHNVKGKFQKLTTSLDDQVGWWNSLSASDLDADGDMDIVAGNYGVNGFLKASAQTPVSIYGKDFDNNGSFDAVLSCFITDSINGNLKEFALAGRDEFIKEMTAMKERYTNYRSYAVNDLPSLFSKEQWVDAYSAKANNFYSVWIENTGNMSFVMHKLPVQAQLAPVYGIQTFDVNADGYTDILVNGNEFSMSPQLGRNDALNGLVLLGTAGKNFVAANSASTGFYLPGNGKSLVMLYHKTKPLFLAGINSNYLKACAFNNEVQQININDDEIAAFVTDRQGRKTRYEFYAAGFLSQNVRRLMVNTNAAQVEVVNKKGMLRKIKMK